MSVEQQLTTSRWCCRRTAGLAIGSLSLFALGIATGMISDGVAESVLAYRMEVAEPKPLPLPTHIPTARAFPASYLPTGDREKSPSPSPAWFPENNKVDWRVSMRPGEVASGLVLHNARLDMNRIVHFQLATGNPGQPWLPAATLYMRAGQSADIRVPRGRYSLSAVNAPIDMPYETVLRQMPVEIAQVDLFQPEFNAIPDLRMTLHQDNRASTVRLSSLNQPSNPGPAPQNALEEVEQLAARYESGPIGTAYDRLAGSLPGPESDQSRVNEDYSSAVLASISKH